MTEYTQPVAEWGLRAAAAGAVVFALGWAWVRRLVDPARRQQLGGWVVRGATLTAILCLYPAWLLVPAPRWSEPKPPIIYPVPDYPAPLEHAAGSKAVPPTVALPSPRVNWSWATPATPGVVAAEIAKSRVRAAKSTRVDPKSTDAPQRIVAQGVWQAPIGPADQSAPDRRVGAKGEQTDKLAVASAPAKMRRANVAVNSGGVISPGSSLPAPDLLPEVSGLLLLAYCIGVYAAGFPLVLGVLMLMRLRGTGKRAPERARMVYDELTAGLRRPPRLLVSDRLASPVCFGLLRPVVMIPKALAWTASKTELRWVLAHELDHLRRGDPWTAWWIGLAKAMYFFVPWFWRVKRDLGLTQEFLADAAAVAAGGRAEDYAAFLVRLSAGPGRRHPVGAAAVRAGKSDLFWRVTMLLDAKDRTAPRSNRMWAAAVAAVVIGTAFVVSGIGFARPDDKKPEATKKADAPKAPAKADDKKPEFDPKDVRIGPPPELAALREAVEMAAKKGENVEAIRKQLDELEKALTGKAWVKPHPAPPAPPAPPAVPGVPGVPGVPAFPQPAPFPGGFQPPVIVQPFQQPQLRIDREAIQKAMEQFRKAQEALAKNPTDKDAIRMMQDAREAMAKAMRPAAVAPFPQPAIAMAFPGAGGFNDFAVIRGDVRLGVRVEKVPAALADQLDLPKGQGVLVSSVVKGTAAEKAGLKANDVILEFAGKPVTDNPNDFVQTVHRLKKDAKVDVTILRKGKKDSIKGIEVPEAKPGEFPGFELNNFPGLPGVDVQPPPVFPPQPPALPPPPVLPPPPPLRDGAKQSSVQVEVSDGAFKINAQDDDIKYLIEGTVTDGTPTPKKIEITDGTKKVEAATIEKVPAQYRDRVKKLLDGVGKRK